MNLCYIRAWLLVVYLMVVFAFSAHGAQTKALIRVAILDLKSSSTAPWLGAAIAESLSTKLAGVDGVTLLEREKVRAMLVAAKGKEITPELFGVQYLVMGTVQLAGTWPDKTARLRVSARVIAAATARIKGNASFVIDGTVEEIFSLESRLAEKLAKALGKKPTLLQIEYHEERTMQVKQLFGQGLVLLREAEGKRQDDKGKGQRAKAERQRDEVKSAIVNLQSAIRLFRRAQQENQGAFFARAHFYEGRARELLAKCQTSEQAAHKMREETVTQFRRDAASAAPAFYDLGRALQANREFEDAIEAYGEYLKWMGASAKALLWDRKAKFANFIGVIEPGRWPDRFMPTKAMYAEGCVYCLEKRQGTWKPYTYVCLDSKTGKVLWEKQDRIFGNDRDQACCLVYKGKLYCFRNCMLLVLDAKTGAELLRMDQPIKRHPNIINAFKGGVRRYEKSLHVSPESPRYVVVACRDYQKNHTGKVINASGFAVVDTEEGRVIWKRDGVHLPKVWNRTVFIPGKQPECLDLLTGRSVRMQYSDKALRLIIDYAILSSRKAPKKAYLVYKPPWPANSMQWLQPRKVHMRNRCIRNIWCINAGDIVKLEKSALIFVVGWAVSDIFGHWYRWRYPFQNWRPSPGTSYLVWDARQEKHRILCLPQDVVMKSWCRLHFVLLGDRIWTISGSHGNRHCLVNIAGKPINVVMHGCYCGHVLLPDYRALNIYPQRESGRGVRLPPSQTDRITCINLLAGLRTAPVSEVSARIRRAGCMLALDRCKQAVQETARVLAGCANLPKAQWLNGLANERLGHELQAFNAYFNCGLFAGDRKMRRQAREKMRTLLPAHMIISCSRNTTCSAKNFYAVPSKYYFRCMSKGRGIPGTDLIEIREHQKKHLLSYLDVGKRRVVWSVSSMGVKSSMNLADGRTLLHVSGSMIRIIDPCVRTDTLVKHDVEVKSRPVGFANFLRSLSKTANHGIILWASQMESHGKNMYITQLTATDIQSGKRLWKTNCRCLLTDPHIESRNLIVGQYLVLSECEPHSIRLGICSYNLRTGKRCGAWWYDPDDTLGGQMVAKERCFSNWNGWILLFDYGYRRDSRIPWFDPATGETGMMPYQSYRRIPQEVILAGDDRKRAAKDPSVVQAMPRCDPYYMCYLAMPHEKSPYVKNGVLFAANRKRMGVLPGSIGDITIFTHTFGKSVLQNFCFTKNYIILAMPHRVQTGLSGYVVYARDRFYHVLGLAPNGLPLK